MSNVWGSTVSYTHLNINLFILISLSRFCYNYKDSVFTNKMTIDLLLISNKQPTAFISIK